MSQDQNIQCKFCGYQFKVYSKQEIHYYDRDPFEETHYYPLESENASYIGNYICNSCCENIEKIIKKNLIDEGNKYVNDLNSRIKEQQEKNKKEIIKLEENNEKIKKLINKLQNKKLCDFTAEDINIYENNYPYTQNGTYYLNKAVDIEKKQKLGLKRIYEWAKEFNINIKEYPNYCDMIDFKTKDEFKNILQDCIIENISAKQLLNIING